MCMEIHYAAHGTALSLPVDPEVNSEPWLAYNNSWLSKGTWQNGSWSYVKSHLACSSRCHPSHSFLNTHSVSGHGLTEPWWRGHRSWRWLDTLPEDAADAFMLSTSSCLSTLMYVNTDTAMDSSFYYCCIHVLTYLPCIDYWHVYGVNIGV